MKKIAPSILSADFSKLGKEVEAITEAGADIIHVDVMDGHFVPNITIGPMIVKAVRACTPLPLDCHLMISDPDRYIEEFVEAGASMISVHAETLPHLHRTIQLIKKSGKQGASPKAGVALNPATPLSVIESVLDEIDYILVMTVNPGFGGQKFIASGVRKITELRKMLNDRKLSCLIEVDGGINPENIRSVSRAGAEIFVAGNAIFGKSASP
ncbi:MAG: ribulose-phosphate 3-epimerase, partial [Deltaproteobacteria bacterium]|nr:ribulose-phosphate 3-epimerase [Deltaproteobacteria bacterium]